jgi:hypothetical protein
MKIERTRYIIRSYGFRVDPVRVDDRITILSNAPWMDRLVGIALALSPAACVLVWRWVESNSMNHRGWSLGRGELALATAAGVLAVILNFWAWRRRDQIMIDHHARVFAFVRRSGWKERRSKLAPLSRMRVVVAPMLVPCGRGRSLDAIGCFVASETDNMLVCWRRRRERTEAYATELARTLNVCVDHQDSYVYPANTPPDWWD